MIRMWGFLTAALFVSISAAAQAQTPPGDQPAAQRPSVITMPEWMNRPVVEFPAAAMSRGITRGRAGVDCGFQRDGRLADCRIILEEPQEFGFGEALLKAASEARLLPQSLVDAAPGARVRFAANFALE